MATVNILITVIESVRTLSHRGKSLQSGKTLLPGGGRLLKSLVPLDELLHLIHTLTHLSTGQVWLLAQQPCLSHTRIP